MQLKLKLPGPVDPAARIWEHIDPDAQRAFVHTLARVIVKALSRQKNRRNKEDRDDR